MLLMFEVMGIHFFLITDYALHFSLFLKAKCKMSRELSDLVIYCKSVHFHGFQHARLHRKCYEMSSFSESKAKKLAKEAGNVNNKEHQV